MDYAGVYHFAIALTIQNNPSQSDIILFLAIGIAFSFSTTLDYAFNIPLLESWYLIPKLDFLDHNRASKNSEVFFLYQDL